MIGIILVGLFNIRVVNNKTEGDVMSLVLPQSSNEWDRMCCFSWYPDFLAVVDPVD
jgi:hypothetical protein